MYGKKFEYTAAKPIKALREYAIKFLVRFGHEERERIITEPLVDKDTISDEEKAGNLTFLYSFHPPVNAKLAMHAMRYIEDDIGTRSLSSLAVVSDSDPFATSMGVLMPPRYHLDSDSA